MNHIMKAFSGFAISSSLLGDEVAKYGHAITSYKGGNARLEFLGDVAEERRATWEAISPHTANVVIVGSSLPIARIHGLSLTEIVAIQEWIETWFLCPSDMGGAAHGIYLSRRELAKVAKAAGRDDVAKWAESYYL